MTEIDKIKHYRKKEFWVFMALSVVLFVCVVNALELAKSPTVITLAVGVVLGEIVDKIREKIQDES